MNYKTLNQFINMMASKLLVIFLLLIGYIYSAPLCSGICGPTACNSQTETDCTGCSTNWVFGSNTCTVDALSGYQLVAESSDMLGATSNVQLLPTTSLYTCGVYKYYGDYACTTTMQISMSSGITIPHYAIQVIVWVIFTDDATWDNSNNINIILGSDSKVRSMSTFDRQLKACGTGSIKQTYYKIIEDYTHINSTNTSILIDLKSDATSGSCTWGFKQAIILAKICDPACTQCYGATSTVCYSCINTKYLSGNTCADSCLSGYGNVTGSNVCISCNIKCIYCSENSTYCSSCQTTAPNQAFLSGSTCDATCPNGTFPNSTLHTCDSCISNCIVCSDSTICITCSTGFLWFNSTCYSACPNGTYSNGQNCTYCDSLCTSCNVSSTNCFTCTTNIAYYYSSTCVTTCPNGTYPSSSPNICNSCDPKCILCLYSSTNCSSCTLSGGNQAYLFNLTCLNFCPSGTYSSTNPNVCVSCDPTCILCSGSSTNCSSCTLNGTNIAYLFNSTCLNNCPGGTYASTNPNLCNSCDLKCTSCSASSTNCSVCTVSGANIAYLYNMSCITTCPSGTYYATGPNVCNFCDAKCINCDTSSTNCSSCTLNGTNQAYLLNLTCITNCPVGTYSTINPNICNSCATQCTACTGPASSECSACSTGNVLSNQTCASSCLTQYGTMSASVCVYCSLYCINCYSVTDNCSSCTTSGTYEAFLDSSVSNYTKCVTSCITSGTVANTANHKCDPCSSNCLTCITTASNCLSCNTGDGWLNYTCYTTCPNGYFKDGNNCTICSSLCATCNGTATNCSVCKSTAYLLNSTCYTLCPDPYYNDNNGGSGPNLCLACIGACASCTGGTNTTCSSCTTNYTLSDTICDTACLTGYGVSSTANVCVLCVSPCTGCYSSGTNCTSCITTPTQYYLITISGSTNCINSCPVGYYLNSTILACLLCPTGCYDCSSDTNCYSCNSTYLFFNNSCYNPCPTGSFQSSVTNCTACDNECKSCFGQSDNCSSCQTGGTYKSFLLGSVCYTTCPGSYYGNAGANQTCKPCNSACLTCNGGNTNNCYLCNYPYYQSGNTCAVNCTTGYGITSTNICVKCNNTCTQCAYLITNCTACQSTGNFSAFLYDDGLTHLQCLMVCPNGTVAINATRTCSACATGCAICINSTTNCTSCITNYGLLNFTCYTPCPNSYYLNGGICSSCSKYCLICNSTNTTCSSCKINGTNKSYFFNNSCLTSCPAGYFKFDNSTLGPTTCQSCNTSCSSCSVNLDNCSYCKVGYYLYNSSCLSACPSGFFPYNSTRSCNDSSVYLTMSIGFVDSLNQQISIKLEFTRDLNHATFPISSFQNITFSDPTLTLQLFKVSYIWTGNKSYQILLQPLTNIFIYNATVTVTTMFAPSPVHQSADGVPFANSTYSKSANINWFLVKGGGWSSTQAAIMNTLSATSDLIQSITTLPGIQEFNKAGLTSLIFPGAQLTSASILINSVPAQNSYEGARFWGNFIYFEVPKWEKDKSEKKYVIQSSADTLATKSRLLQPKRDTFQLDSLYWRFYRTGFTTFFLFDCYMQMFLIILSWVLLIIARYLQNKVKQSKISRLYSIFHSLHEITIFYLSLGLILELMYFDMSSATRVVSLILCLSFNVYYIIYQLYVYYQLIKYPLVQLGSQQYREMAKKYGYFLKRIRFQQYQDIEKWSPKHIFRPYNYHIVSFYKKYLMIIAVVLFYEYPQYAAGVLVLLQLFELVRFILTWPFASKARNIIRLLLEITILIFFLSVFLQVYYMAQISQNNMQTIADATNSYYIVGWIGFACIFIFNTTFFVIFLYNICCFITKSNSEEMREIRKDFYYQKIIKFENCNEITADNQLLDSWVIKGDLNEHWVQDKQIITPDIDITVQKYVINKMGDGFTIQMEKIGELDMKQPSSTVFKQKVKVRQQINGTIGLTKAISPTFFKIILDIFQQYDPNYLADFLTLKTIAKIQSRNYKSGDTIKLQDQMHVQTLVLKYPGDEKKVHKLAVPLKGFPIKPDILNPLIFNKTLNKKRLY